MVVGLIAGWLAGQLVQGTGFGVVGDIIIGIIGAFIGAWLLPQLGIRIGAGLVSAIASATIGAAGHSEGCPTRWPLVKVGILIRSEWAGYPPPFSGSRESLPRPSIEED